MALKANGPETPSGLAGQKTGVRSATTTLDALPNSLAARNIDAEVIQFDNHPAGMAALQSDAITAYFTDQSILMTMVLGRETPQDSKVMQEFLTVEKQGLAMARGDTAFRLAVDRGLSELFLGGTMRRILEETIPGARTGLALEAMFLLSPTVP